MGYSENPDQLLLSGLHRFPHAGEMEMKTKVQKLLFGMVLQDPKYWGEHWHIHALDANINWFIERKRWFLSYEDIIPTTNWQGGNHVDLNEIICKMNIRDCLLNGEWKP